MKALNHSSTVISILSLGLLAWLGAGCESTETQRIHVQPSPIPATATESKLPMSAVLVIDKEFKDHSITVGVTGGLVVYPLGEALSRYAEDVSKSLFREVTLCDSTSGALNRADVILVPRVARSTATIYPVTLSLCVEWMVKDRSGQQRLWLTYPQAEATQESGLQVMKQKRLAFQRVFDDLTLKTVKAFQESPEMKRVPPGREASPKP